MYRSNPTKIIYFYTKVILRVVNTANALLSLFEIACCGEKKKIECVIRGYHIHKAIWAAAIGEELVCTKEATNAANRYAITAMNKETII